MFMKFFNNNKAFTLIETLVALSIGIVLATVFITVVTFSLKNARQTAQAKALHANAMAFTETLNYWGKQATDFDTSVLETLYISLPDTGVRKEFSKNGDTILFGDEGTTGDLTTDSVLVDSLVFTPLANSIKVSFVLKSGNLELPVTTTVASRNKI